MQWNVRIITSYILTFFILEIKFFKLGILSYVNKNRSGPTRFSYINALQLYRVYPAIFLPGSSILLQASILYYICLLKCICADKIRNTWAVINTTGTDQEMHLQFR